ncbi:MAG: tetratricopeptide repeat protein [Salinivirgaceae bacterium]|nr:tetratricopeptide repeat protein [Salinivirgaceae bacterium]
MRLALYGDGNNYGFLYILDEYSGTPSANLANYYSGIAFLNIGEYDKAIRHLGSFSSDDIILSTIAQGAIGDALVQKGEIEKGAKQYMKAALNKKDKLNVPVILMKAGIAFEEIGKYDKALIAYKMIQSNYSKSREARMIEKYISKAEVLAKK